MMQMRSASDVLLTEDVNGTLREFAPMLRAMFRWACVQPQASQSMCQHW